MGGPYTGCRILVRVNDALPTRSAPAQALSFLGGPGRTAFFPLASRRLPRQGKSGACALDVDTAWALFRTTGPESNRVRVNGNFPLVVGVLDAGASAPISLPNCMRPSAARPSIGLRMSMGPHANAGMLYAAEIQHG